MREMEDTAVEMTYLSVLRGILSSGTVGDAELHFLENFRSRASISEAQHVLALQRMGYTESDFAAVVERSVPVEALANMVKFVAPVEEDKQDDVVLLPVQIAQGS